MLKWLSGVLKARLDAFLGTKAILSAVGIIVALLLPDVPNEVRAEIVAAIIAIYTAFRAWQNRAVIQSKPESELAAKMLEEWKKTHPE